MKNSISLLIITLLLNGCYKSGYEGAPATEASLGTGIFQESGSSKIAADHNPSVRKIANSTAKLYMFEQQALFKARLDDHAITAEIDEQNDLTLSIPGNICFSINSAAINWNMHAILDKVSAILRAYVDTSITVIGHTDARGNPAINQMLSKQRAMSITNYLIRTKVPESRIIYYGISDREQVSDNESTLDRSLNRRVQIIISPMLPPPPPSSAVGTEQVDQGETIISPYSETDAAP